MLKQIFVIFFLVLFNIQLAYGVDNQVATANSNNINNEEDIDNTLPSGLRLNTAIGYSYYDLNGNYGNEKTQNPYAMIDITYLIRNSFEIGFGFGADKLLLAKKGVNVPDTFRGDSASYDNVIPSFIVVRYNINLANNQDLVLSTKIGNAFGFSSNYTYSDQTNDIYQEKYFQSVGFLGASLGYAINNWVISLDYFAYEIIAGERDYVKVSPNSNLLYGVSSYDRDYTHKLGLSLTYRLTSFINK